VSPSGAESQRTGPFTAEVLSDAAGGLIGGYRHHPKTSWSNLAAAQLLMLVGANEALVEQRAAATVAHLSAAARRTGIGNR
jgi:hypothetical protein